MVSRESPHCLDGGILRESCLPSDTWFWMWVVHDQFRNQQSKDCRNILGILEYRQNKSFCVRRVRIRNLLGKLHHSFSNKNPTCSTIVDVLETSGVQLDPQGDNVFCSHFSRCVLHNGTHCAGNMSFFPCQSENPAYLAHFLGTFEDEDKDGKLFVRPTLRGS